MTRLVLLPSREPSAFDSPPRLTRDGRATRFHVTNETKRMISGLGSSTNKVGFLLQLGYFDITGKFFTPKQFRRKDIKFVRQLLSISDDIDFSAYETSRMLLQHRKRILALRRWTPFDDDNAAFLAKRVQLLAQQQLKPDQVFRGAFDFCWEHHIEIPTYHQLALVITDSFNIVETAALSRLAATLSEPDCSALDALVTVQAGARVDRI